MRAIAAGRLAVLISTFGLLMGAPDGVFAQSGAGSGEPTYEERGAELLAQIEADRAEGRRLVSRASEREGAFARVLQRRAEDAGLDAMDRVHDLARLVIERQEAGEDPGEFLPAVVGLLDRIHTGSQEYVARLASDPELRANLGNVAELAPAEAAAIEAFRAELSHRIVAIYRKLITNLELSEALGIDAAGQRAYLETAVRNGAETLSVSLELALEQIDALSAQSASLPDDAEIKARISIMQGRVSRVAGTLGDVTAMMGPLELEADSYKQQLIEVTGSVTTDIFDIDVLTGLLSRWLGDFGSWLADHAPQFIFQVLLFLLVIWIALVLSRLTRRLVTRGLAATKLRLSRLLKNMIISTVANLVLLLGVLFGLAQIGISVGPLLAGLGIAGFIVGFALQDTLGNFASGMMILLYRPYDVGDLIEAGGVFGKVSSMSLVNTTVLTLDNQTLVMPNSKIWGDVIKNVTAQRVRRVDMVFGIGYSDDIPKAEEVLNEIVHAHDKVLKDPEAVVRLHTLGESSVDFIVRPWTRTDDYWDVYWDITRAVKLRFDAEGISIPFPQRDVHVFSGDQGSVAAIVPARMEAPESGQGAVAMTGKDAPDAPDARYEESGDADAGGEDGSSSA